jgi:hypothetical protein
MSLRDEAMVAEPLGAGLEEPPDRNGAFPRLDEDQRALLAVGELQPVSAGEVLFRAATTATTSSWWIPERSRSCVATAPKITSSRFTAPTASWAS